MIKRGKRGQVTLFIIIAIVVVALGIMTWAFWPRIQAAFMTEEQAKAFLARKGPELQDAVHYCVRGVSEDIFTDQGLHAGYYSYPHLVPVLSGQLIVMYIDTNKKPVNRLPIISQMASEYTRALEDEEGYAGYTKINSCLGNFAAFKREMEVEPGELEITAEIHDEDILVKVDWPITIRKGPASATLQQRDVQLLIPLGRVWTVANDIVECEVRVDCNYEGTEFDTHIWDNPFILYNTKKDPMSLSANVIAWRLETRPYREGELPYIFEFAIDRT